MRSNNKLIFIGTIKKVANCGESMKNHLFLDRFREVFDKVITVDVFKPMKHPWCVVKLVLILIFHRHSKTVLSVSPATADKFLTLLLSLGCDNIFYWAVGVSLMDGFNTGRFDIVKYNKIKSIYVQSPKMVESLKNHGLENVLYVPNSKPILCYPDIQARNNKLIRFVFLSRMDPTKGCEIILDCANELAEHGYRGKFKVDFYGLIAESKKQWFNSFTNKLSRSTHCEYKGFLDLKHIEGYNTLSGYDVMLFPTFYKGEAFPGIIIDAFIAGVPVIASDWHFNKDIITQQTGLIIPVKDRDALYQAMKNILDGHINLKDMAYNCQQEAKKYDNKVVLSNENLKKIGFIN